MNCPNCSHTNPETHGFCENCGAPLEAHPVPIAKLQGQRGSAATLTKASGPGIRTVIPGTPVILGDGEKVWREYPVTQLRTREQGLGTLYVTDSRVIFLARTKGRGTQRDSALIQETQVDKITGLSAYVSNRVSLFWLLASFYFGLSSLISLFVRSKVAFIVFAILCGGAIWILIHRASKLRGVGVRIHSGSSNTSPIGFGDFGEGRGFIGRVLSQVLGPVVPFFQMKSAFDVLIGRPTADADRVISELGALIIDLQSKGSLAETHWGVGTTSSSSA
jgi:hypothetical protein